MWSLRLPSFRRRQDNLQRICRTQRNRFRKGNMIGEPIPFNEYTYNFSIQP